MSVWGAGLLVAAGLASDFAAAHCLGAVQGTGHGAAAVDGRTFRMSDGAEIRLAGIAPLLADQASATELATLIAGRDVTLHGDSDMPDRYGRQTAFVITDPGLPTVQAQLLARGAALASGSTADRACGQELAAAEALARRSRRGLWALDGVIKNAESAGDILAELGRFVVVEGRVVSVREAGATTYVNFGRRWTQDFAVTIPRRMMSAFQATGITAKSLERQRIRVRGWVERRGGPRIEARFPGQIEVVGDN